MTLTHRKIGRMTWKVLIICVAFISATRTHAATEQWSWELFPDMYKTMGPFERGQYDKAAKLYREGELQVRHNQHSNAVETFKAAVGEWKKFRVLHGQSVDVGILAHSIFMEARSYHSSRDRYHAIKSYTEVLDYFPDELWVAAPALFFRGIAHIDNGDVRQGLEDMKAMYDDPDYRLHPLAAGALRRLADNHWRNNEQEQAVRYWKEVDRIFAASNQGEAENARNSIMDYYIRGQRYNSIIEWRLEPDERNDATKRRNIANWAWNRAFHNFHHAWSKYEGDQGRLKYRDIEAFHEWLVNQEKWYREKNDLWTFYSNMIDFITRYERGKGKEAESYIDQFAQLIQASEIKDADKDSRFFWLVDRAMDFGKLDKARVLLKMAKDQPWAMWKEYEVLAHRLKKWKDAAETLKLLSNVKNDYWKRRATFELADVYRTQLGMYEDAIKIYLEISEPPETLWRIQDAYRRWGKTDKALTTLKEISSMFPDHAARALYTQAEYHRQDGRDKLAVGLYRQILKHPNWKQTNEASQSHQRLEEYGIETGGGVINED